MSQLRELTGNYDNDRQSLIQYLRIEDSFDLLEREVVIGGRRSSIFFVDGFTKAEIMEKMLEFLMKQTPEQIDACKDTEEFIRHCISYVETEAVGSIEQLATQILSGNLCLLVEGFSKGILIDVREYPIRSIQEPEDDRVLRGAHDGFCETLMFNAALIRRRIRSPQLTLEAVQIGGLSKTDVAMCYMRDQVDPKLLHKIRQKLQSITIPSLTMAQESLTECLIRKQWYNPFPRIRYTERPDCAAAGVLEGSILLMIDNTPSVMILPTCLFDFVQDTNDYYFPPIAGSYLRFVRAIIFLSTLFITPVWFLLMQNPDMIPSWLEFVRVKEPNTVPIIAQLLVIEIIIDGIKLASLNTPGSLTNAFGIVGALLLGEFAVMSGFFVPEVLLYMAFIAIGSFTQPSFELTYAFKLFRILFLVLTALFNWWGFLGGAVLMVVVLLTTNTATGYRYCYPLIPFNAKALWALLIRRPLRRFNSGGGQRRSGQ